MIFGGYGRKTKERGELIYVCMECQDITSYRLTENYKYEHLYGIRVAKHGTKRMLVCSRCQRGWDISKDQWNAGKALAKELQQMPGNVSQDQVAAFCLRVADEMFPDHSRAMRSLLLGDPSDDREIDNGELGDEDDDLQLEEEPPGEPMGLPAPAFCPSCGYQAYDERFCPRCGTNLDDVRAKMSGRRSAAED